MPENPENGKWNCDIEKNGNVTVCLLECNSDYTLKGSHIIECEHEKGEFDPEPTKSSCVETGIAKFNCKNSNIY